MKRSNIIYHQASVTRQRRNKLNNHRSIVLWFTGLSGSGKSTLAHALEEKLFKKGCRTFVLDGDNVRYGLNSNLDFSEKGRTENIRRISEVSKLMLESGLIVMTAFISPFNKDREDARKLISSDDFIEIFCKASLEACEARDVKGLYKRARAGEIKNYTGIDSPYEVPEKPELIIDTDNQSLEESVSIILNFLELNGIAN
ncbi:adenylyl-sulfate kinase [Candidatus Pseudothioglobus sp. Uisw_041]|jgi:adenylylsulfate kinase|uniref:adenylyl-sulfate kinase n=1 Tax=Candidatus Pseudothioglobus sp. Uisw_041 TaxID=3230996 RepID=UPI003A87793E